MSYAVQADLLQRITAQELVQLTDDGKTGQVDFTKMQGALDEATGTIESYVRARYQTPLQISTTATSLCRDLAIYNLYSRRPQFKMPETVRQRWEDAIQALKDISTGKASLDQPVGAATPQTPTGGAVLPQSTPLRFSDCNLRGWD